MSRLKNNGLLKHYLPIALSVLVFMGLVFSSQAMAGTRYEETDATFSVGWLTDDDPGASGGFYKYTNNLNASCSFTFTGKSISWIGAKAKNLGISEVLIDGVLMKKVDLYAPDNPDTPDIDVKWKQVLYTADNLPLGEHEITITPTSEKNPSSSGLYTVVDAFYVCNEKVCVVSPSSEDVWREEEAHPISLAINTTPAQYGLYLKCGTQKWDTKNIMALRTCDYYGECPGFLWVAPPIVPANYTTLPCQIAVQLFDKDITKRGAGISDIFLLQTSDPSVNFYIDPLYQTAPAGGSAGYEVKGGTPDYIVGTARNMSVPAPGYFQLQENYGITAFKLCSTSTNTVCNVDADCPLGETCIATIPGSRLSSPNWGSPYTFTVKNNLSCGSDTTVVVWARDSQNKWTFSLYNIDCP